MDPQNPESFSHKLLSLGSGRNYHVVDQCPNLYNRLAHPTLLCIHGFPDCWIGWKHQIKPWVEAGYRVVAPDMLGYGGTDKPEDKEQYSLKSISNDLACILKNLEVDKAFVIGHDWGSHIAGRFALWYPGMVLGVVHISIGYFPPVSPYKSLKEEVEANPIYKYQLYFEEEARIEEIERNLKNFFKYAFNTHVFSGPEGIPTNFGDVFARGQNTTEQGRFLLNEKELEYFVSRNESMRGPTNYYRTWKIRHEEEVVLQRKSYPKGTPVLFLVGDQDATGMEEGLTVTRGSYPMVEIKTYEGAAHWLMIEKKDEVMKDVLAWLTEHRPC